MKRIFIAINLPEEIKAAMQNLQKETGNLFLEEMDLEEEANRGVIKWVKKENLHLTLVFVGKTEQDKIFKISNITENIIKNQNSFSLQTKNISYGPDKKIPPRLIWVELEKNNQLLNIVDNLKKELLDAQILRREEQRSFSPHITLGRIKAWSWKKINPEERPEINKTLSFKFKINSIDIMESIMKRTGAEYTCLKSFQLK